MASSPALSPRCWLRNIGYILLVLVWLFVMTVPCFAFVLATRGEVSWTRAEHDWDRVWLIQERAQQGLGLQSERVVNDQSAAGGPICIRDTVHFFLWRGRADGQDSDTCQCETAGLAGPSATCP